MLVGNYTLFNNLPARFLAGTSVSMNRSNFNTPGLLVNRFTGDSGILTFTQIPNGYTGSFCWALGRTGGGFGSNTEIVASGIISNANLAGGRNAECEITGAISVSNADLALIVSLVSSLTGQGELLSSIAGVLQAASTLTGYISLSTGALGAIVDALASINASGQLTTADLTNSARLLTMALSANVSISTAIFAGLGNIESDILPYTELSPESLANAVWSKSTLDELDSGTYGKLMKQLKALISAGL